MPVKHSFIDESLIGEGVTVQNLGVSKTVDTWSSLADTVFVPNTEAEYQRLVALLDRLVVVDLFGHMTIVDARVFDQKVLHALSEHAPIILNRSGLRGSDVARHFQKFLLGIYDTDSLRRSR
jgi:hypothetical protein